MADESENIEARLAAYIDGEMAPGERSDIEAYLAANPSHAKLIGELRDQRAGLTALPREKAPPEIMDHLQQHLERHALLDESGDEGGGSMRVNRWPQLTAAAAMLLLAAGLGLLVYQVLPGGGRPEQVVLAPGVRDNLAKLQSPEEIAATERSDADAAEAIKAKALAAEVKPATPSIDAAPSVNSAMPSVNAATPNVNQLNQSQSYSNVGTQAQVGANQMASNAMPQNAAPQDAQATANASTNRALADDGTSFRGPAALSNAKDAMPAPGGAAGAAGGGDRPKDFVEEMADRMAKRQAQMNNGGLPAAPHATLSVVSDDPAMSGALVAEYLVQSGIAFDTARVPSTAPSTQPAMATLVLHDISPDRARQVQVAIADQRAGRQQVSLEFSRRAAAPVTTQPAKTEAQAIAMVDKAIAAPSTQKSDGAVAMTPPAVAMPAATEPATRDAEKSLKFDDAKTTEEAGDLWIVIQAPAPTPAPAPATTEPSVATPPLPATLPATLPALPLQ